MLISAMKLKDANYENHWNFLVFLRPMKSDIRFKYVPWRNVWFCFIFIVSVRFSQNWEISILKVIEIHWFFLIKNWCQIWIRPVKQYLIWFKLCCFSKMLAISWKVRILNFIASRLRNLLSDQNFDQNFVPSYLYFSALL